MSAPTHIRFTQDESDAIDAYADAHGLRKASAVRELLRLGLESQQRPREGAAVDLGPLLEALGAIDARLARVERTLNPRGRPRGRPLPRNGRS